jgi:hypothetical protein
MQRNLRGRFSGLSDLRERGRQSVPSCMFCVESDFHIASNEKEIRHGKVRWQSRQDYFDEGPLASSIGQAIDNPRAYLSS